MKRFNLPILLSLLLPLAAPAQTPAFKVLVYSYTAGYRHDSIPNGIALIQALGATNNFAVDHTEDASLFTDTNLAQYQAIVFLNTTGDVLTNAAQSNAFQHYIEAGGGYVGVHSASDTFHNWPWYGGLVGAYYVEHPVPQQATIRIEDRTDPSTTMLPSAWVRTDEWYNFDRDPRGRVHVLATLDESTYSGGTMGADHPIAWSQYYDGGRAWYTESGHTTNTYSEPLYQAHLLGGILFAAGAAAGHPLIALRRSPGTVTLSWPSGATGFVPETATNLQTGALWSTVTNATAVSNGQKSLSFPPTNSLRFFRVKK